MLSDFELYSVFSAGDVMGMGRMCTEVGPWYGYKTVDEECGTRCFFTGVVG